MQAQRLGEHALLIDCESSEQVAATYAALRSRAAELGALDVVPAARTVLLDGLADPVAALARLAGWPAVSTADDDPAPASRLVEIGTRYDGADLDEVARQWQCSTADVVRIHTGCTFVVLFCGFAPGFGYCTGLPDGLSVRRRADPRAAVPAGSVALADEYTSVYPTSSPGGWQLIGTTAVTLWDPAADEPAVLSPGTRVRFIQDDG